ncbi:MAG TPA: M1 family metallopeptidase [Flavisolibacter sp.]|nr:M1 family metallopeptidase [Flavisolibacter sp.]
MNSMKLIVTACALFLASASFAQQLFVPKNIQAAYQKGTRSSDGKPGKNYWQNTASYRLNVSFAPDTRMISGTVNINYVNNSPDTLKQIWFKLYPNLYKKGTPRQSKISPEDLTDGVSIDSMWVNEMLVNNKAYDIDGTNMTLNRQSVVHGQSIRFKINYHYILNKTSHVRTGEIEPNADFIAYFFPRVAVYDDIDGWNRFPYNGSQEFYNDFSNFEAFITVPKKFVVWATGDLQNAKEVMNPIYVQRIQKAEMSDGITTIIDSSDLKQSITTDRPFNTWHFVANDVTDFVFATSDHYIWKSSSLIVDPVSKRRTRVDAVFNPKHKDYFEVINDARKTVEAMSYQFPKWPYPYSHETVFDGLDQMEYPMMVNDNPVEARDESIELTDHEIFHTMFPFYMGINETKYAWMDEGWATIGEWLISPMIDTTIVDEYGVAPYEMSAASEIDLPITTLSTQLTGTSYFLNSYPKPAFGYLYAKDMLGDSLFTKALHYYIQQWHGKHPIPYDFFNCMNAGAGKNMSWFWKKWFFDNGEPDLAITSVSNKLKSYSITITSKGTKPVPIDLTITYVDKSISKVHRSIAVWEKGNSTVSITIPTSEKITKVELGSTYSVDANKKDNIFILK